MSQIKKHQGNADKANKATQELLKKAGPHIKTLQKSIEKTSEAWTNAGQMIEKISNMNDDEAAQLISAKLKTATDIMLIVLDRLKNDPELQEETKKLFCLFGESLKEAMMIITETIVEMAPPASEALIKALKTTVPLLNAAIIASWGTLQEIAFTACPPCAAVYNLVDTGGKLITQFGFLMSKVNDSAASVSEMGSAGLGVFTKKTPAIEKIINNFGEIIEHLANLTDVMANATNIENKLQKGGKKHTRKKQKKGGNLSSMKKLIPPPTKPIPIEPSFSDVLSAWGVVGFAPFDIFNLQEEANKRNAQLQKDLAWLETHVPTENIQDVEYAVGITKNYMNKPKKGGKHKKHQKHQKRKYNKKKTKKTTLKKKNRASRRRITIKTH